VKLKFWEDVTCRVTAGRDGNRSVGLELLENEAWIPVGNVTIPANAEIPSPGSLVDIRYLYAYPGGSLFQPTYLRPRTDVAPEECHTGRLKYKNASAPREDALALDM
jgi:bifunctional non-homologous end joining protein LigD